MKPYYSDEKCIREAFQRYVLDESLRRHVDRRKQLPFQMVKEIA